MELAPDVLVAGKLRVIRRLGAGGVGSVWEVEHTLTRHRRALKVLHPKYAGRADVVERFLREASAAGRIGSPHIVETFDAGQLESSEPWLLMELLSGESFGDRLRGLPLELDQVVFVVRQACLGVAAAHDAGIVHRDLKPDNLFITQAQGKPFVKLLDFGVSRFDELSPGDAKLTSEGTTLGTPLYMSPEQISGRTDLDQRADIYSLGVILYQAVTGKPPFEAGSLAALAVQIHRGQPIPLSQLRPELPKGFVEVVEKAMNPERDRRYPDARALYDALAVYEVEVMLDQTAIPASNGPSAAALASRTALATQAAPARKFNAGRWLLLGAVGAVATVLCFLYFDAPASGLSNPAPLVAAPAGPSLLPPSLAPPPLAVPPSGVAPPSANVPVAPQPPAIVAAPGVKPQVKPKTAPRKDAAGLIDDADEALK